MEQKSGKRRKGMDQKIITRMKGELRAWIILVEHQKPGGVGWGGSGRKGGIFQRWDLALAAGHSHHAVRLPIFSSSSLHSPHRSSRFGRLLFVLDPATQTIGLLFWLLPVPHPPSVVCLSSVGEAPQTSLASMIDRLTLCPG